MNYNKSGLVVLLACVIFSFIYFVYIVFFSDPIRLAELKESASPNIQAEDLGDTSSEASQQAPSEEKSAKAEQPAQGLWLSTPKGVAHGGKVYQTYCASCHGPKGQGDGPAGGALKPPPRDLVKGDWKQGGSSIALYKTLTQGMEGTSMVSFSYLSKEDRWALVHYIRSITQDKTKDNLKELEEFGKQTP